MILYKNFGAIAFMRFSKGSSPKGVKSNGLDNIQGLFQLNYSVNQYIPVFFVPNLGFLGPRYYIN